MKRISYWGSPLVAHAFTTSVLETMLKRWRFVYKECWPFAVIYYTEAYLLLEGDTPDTPLAHVIIPTLNIRDPWKWVVASEARI